MISEKGWINKMRSLPPERRQAVIDFIEFLSLREQQSAPEAAPNQPMRGLWSDLNIQIDADAIDEARRQMWSNFPHRDLP